MSMPWSVEFPKVPAQRVDTPSNQGGLRTVPSFGDQHENR